MAEAEALDSSWVLFRHTGEREPGDNWAYRRLRSISDREIDESLQGQHTITHMKIYNYDLISDHVLERATELTHLEVIQRAGDFTQRLSKWIRRLTHLQSLRLYNLGDDSPTLPDLPVSEDWATALESLVKLELERYNLRELPSILASLKQLRKLKLNRCDVSQLPGRVVEWGGITELELECFDFSKGLPPLFMSLSQLRTLKISKCELKELPDRVAEWGGLTELELESCDFSDGLPPLFMSLSQLRTLRISNCKLKELPDSVKQLVCLRKIDLPGNHLETLPSSVFNLPCIELIDLAENDELKYLSSSKLEMSRLQKLPELVLSDCVQLRQPPLQVCLQGTEAILNYYTAIGKDES